MEPDNSSYDFNERITDVPTFRTEQSSSSHSTLNVEHNAPHSKRHHTSYRLDASSLNLLPFNDSTSHTDTAVVEHDVAVPDWDVPFPVPEPFVSGELITGSAQHYKYPMKPILEVDRYRRLSM